jgi:hypothetical protein
MIREGNMDFTGEQVQAIEKIKQLLYDDSEADPSRFYAVAGAIMAEDDANDSALESYRKYKR